MSPIANARFNGMPTRLPDISFYFKLLGISGSAISSFAWLEYVQAFIGQVSVFASWLLPFLGLALVLQQLRTERKKQEKLELEIARSISNKVD